MSNVGILDSTETDAIGEILNISMGSAATAISTMLDKQVVITTPKVSQQQMSDIDYGNLEPAMLVKIEYIEGITGSNVMMFRQRDMQIILNLLMGNEEPPTDDFVFDELSMSAACEVMNQMMGASATALSEFLGKSINISTPTAYVMGNDKNIMDELGLQGEQDILSVSFDLNIEGVMNSEFISVLSLDLARMIVNQVMGGGEDADATPVQAETTVPEQEPAPVPAATIPAPAPVPAPAPAPETTAPEAPIPAASVPGASATPMTGTPAAPMGTAAPIPGMPAAPEMAAYPPQAPYAPPMGYPQGYPVPGYPTPGYPVPPYPYEQPQQAAAPGVMKQEVNVQTPQFPQFTPQPASVLPAPVSGTNLDLIMNVPLAVSIEIGKTKKKIREIMDFTQGTVIELEKQAGAPVDIVVNGQLIARGDVVVIEDNFGVRVTEIIGTKDLVNSLENNNNNNNG